MDREKVVNGLECCIRHGVSPTAGCGYKNECPYEREGIVCWIKLNEDALELLKEQEAVEPKKESDGNPGMWASWWYVCGNCGEGIDWHDRYCWHCGRAVKWN